LKRFLSDDVRAATLDVDAQRELLSQLPAAFESWSPLAQDQYLEVHTLLSGYLLSSQGDRMLMANSVEGRFPFLDRNVAALAESLPPAYKLRVLDEKHVLKRVGVGLVPSEILDRKKQPYRSPDALAFSGAGAAGEWIGDVTSADKLKDAGLFRPESAAQLIRKCLSRGSGQFSNADNMACVGILSAQLLHEQFVRVRPAGRAVTLRTAVDRVAGAAPSLANTTSAPGV
jgi:asparagine synthase (glutamine-hydrolysing)